MHEKRTGKGNQSREGTREGINCQKDEGCVIC